MSWQCKSCNMWNVDAASGCCYCVQIAANAAGAMVIQPERKVPLLLPMNGRIVVEAISEEKTPSGLYLPSGAAEQRATIGKVIALPLGWSRPSEVEGIVIQEGLYEGPLEVGDVVLFGQNSGMLIDLGHGAARRKAIILRESEVLCKVTNADGSPYA